MKNTTGQTYSEPDIGMRLTAKNSNVWAQTIRKSTLFTTQQTIRKAMVPDHSV